MEKKTIAKLIGVATIPGVIVFGSVYNLLHVNKTKKTNEVTQPSERDTTKAPDCQMIKFNGKNAILCKGVRMDGKAIRYIKTHLQPIFTDITGEVKYNDYIFTTKSGIISVQILKGLQENLNSRYEFDNTPVTAPTIPPQSQRTKPFDKSTVPATAPETKPSSKIEATAKKQPIQKTSKVQNSREFKEETNLKTKESQDVIKYRIDTNPTSNQKELIITIPIDVPLSKIKDAMYKYIYRDSVENKFTKKLSGTKRYNIGFQNTENINVVRVSFGITENQTPDTDVYNTDQSIEDKIEVFTNATESIGIKVVRE